MDNILIDIATGLNIPIKKIQGNGRGTFDIATARHLFCFIAYENGYNLSEIGRFLSYRDHTTIINSIKVVNNLRDTKDAVYERFVTLLRHNAPNLGTSLYKPRKRYSGDGCIISRFQIVKCA
jgi:chromosomal replication initiation ATPase DnaA